MLRDYVISLHNAIMRLPLYRDILQYGAMYTVHCTVYNMHCTVCIVHIVQCILYTLCNDHCTMYNVHYVVHYTLCPTLYIVHCTIHNYIVLSIVHDASEFTLHVIICIISIMLYDNIL